MLYLNAASLPTIGDLASLARMAAQPDFIVSGFPEYATAPEALAPDQRVALTRAVDAIERSQSTYCPVMVAIVIGHADKALRKSPPERGAFELQVSQNRASAAAETLRNELVARSGGAHYAKVFRMPAIGIGNARPIHVNAVNEQQMRANRRVEITLLACWVGAPRCAMP